MSCKPVKTTSGQAFPRTGELARNIDRRLPGFVAKSPPSSWNNDRVFAYVLTTLDIDHAGEFVQKGSAPNFQGGLISLCSCMHYHRTWWPRWRGMWVAGFCGKNQKGGNQLFYLMQVGEEYDSQADLWHSLGVSTRNAKSARGNRFGDVYEPNGATAATAYEPGGYFPPYGNGPDDQHVHLARDHWKQDICFRYPVRDAKQPKLLIGDPERSFLWQRPRYAYMERQHPRNRVYDSMTEFYQYLRFLR